jgi:hypothetical protein
MPRAKWLYYMAEAKQTSAKSCMAGIAAEEEKLVAGGQRVRRGKEEWRGGEKMNPAGAE